MKRFFVTTVSLILIIATISVLYACDLPFIDNEEHVQEGITLNGLSLKKYTLVVPDKEEYELPIATAKRFFKKYCGVTIKVKDDASKVNGNKIVVGATKADGSEYTDFEAEIYTKDGDIYLGCKNTVTAQRALYAFFAKYLSDVDNLTPEIPDNQNSLYYTDEPNWDEADPAILTIQDKIVRGCYKVEDILKFDTANGKPYTYQNHGYPDTIAEARETNNRTTNCVILGNWVMKDAGFYSTGIYNHTYDGTTGYQFESEECEAFFNENFEIIDMREKDIPVEDLTKKGIVWPGDIIGYSNHNQMIMPCGYTSDAGRSSANMETPQTGGKFNRWISPNPYGFCCVGFIIRAKDATKY